MQKDNISKINTFGKVGHIICKIGGIVVIIAAIACLISAVIMCFVPKNAVKIELYSSNFAFLKLDDSLDFLNHFELDGEDGLLEIGDNTYKLNADNKEGNTYKTTFYLSDIKWVLFAATIALGALYTVLHYGSKLCACFKSCTTPFTEEVSCLLTKLAWSLVAMLVLGTVISGAVAAFMEGSGFSISVDLLSVLLVLCVFMLSYVFKHGTALQAQSDETL